MNKSIESYIFIKIKSIIFKNIKNLPYKFFLFGSRVKGDAKKRSDYDIGFISENGKKINSLILSDIQDGFDNIPAIIDLIDFSEVSEDFKKNAMKNIIWLNKTI
ncbi:MAG: nucleotidyltransferase domain-containing protein [Candidatus Gracilibacteria bacterium]|nr:nucleotidyltransferase domain-containing protein [Candidatus Gracilibacteria bacterium]MDQ7023806.1 nucleotidyltransferase domain-containing protein [Candidatus Gracilibacteria bacterium]